MPTRELLTPAQRLRLDELPVDLDDRLMARYHTLSEEELAAALRRRTPTGRLGFAVQIALLKFPGRPLRAAEAAPEKIARYVASQLGEDPRAIDSYVGAAGGRTGAGRETTRREHLSEISKMLGLRHFDGDARAELRAWLLGVAAITDSGVALVEALLEEMRRRAIVVPAMYAVEGLAWEARREARRAVAEALVGGLAREQLAQLDILPEGLDAFRRRLYSFLPRVRLTDLLVEVDSWCGFSEHLTDLRTGRPCKDRELAYAAVLADGTNLGPTKMAEATDDPKVTYERLAWAADWHVREETYQKAIAEVVNAHYRLPFSQHWGEGRTSSSDGQVFFAGGPKDALSQPNAKYGRDRGVVFYTHISDQYAPFYSRVINTTVRDATYVLDGLLYHESDLDLREHHSDTEGFTDQVFGATHLLGYRFAPRIRNIKKTKLFPIRKPSRYPNLAPMIGGKVNVKEISSSWDEVLRLAASIKTGTVTASLILSKLANYPRQNGLAKALREIGKIERSLFGLAWYQDLELRRRVNAGLNKGEARNALARAVFFNRLGELRDRSYEDQQARASGLTLLCSAIGLWNAVYLEKVVAGLRSRGEEIPEEYLRHLSPLEWEHVTLTGVYRWNLEEGPVSEGGFHTLRGVRSPFF